MKKPSCEWRTKASLPEIVFVLCASGDLLEAGEAAFEGFEELFFFGLDAVGDGLGGVAQFGIRLRE